MENFGIITEAFVQQFADNFSHIAQQKMSRLETAVRVEAGIVGMSKSVDALGRRSARRRTVRHADTPLNDQPFSRRFVDLFDWEDGDMIDDQDKIRMLVDPQSGIVQAMVAGLNRAKDRVIIDALGGAARTTIGTIALPPTQRVADGGDGLTKEKLIFARKLFRQNEADAEAGEELCFAYAASQLSDLLNDANLTNTEVNTVLSLMNGEITKGLLMGFKFIPTELLVRSGNVRQCFAWAKSGAVLGIGQDIVTKLGEDPGKGFNVRVYARMSLGAVRVEEEKVVRIDCVES
ncbi:MAG: hypothetical protein LBL72_09380 [Candidatus Accumulibacter sp.]|jgi:hypothetical protein|nr:hypothetical protein [Accumulibacter sp.]